MTTRRMFMIGAAASSLVATPRLAIAEDFGSFDGTALLNFIGEQLAIVEREISYRDPDGLTWKAPKGIEVNGASIPRALWSIVGAPFSGGYLRASVVHDHYCVTMERDWRATHYAFYLGCRADGLSYSYASLLYAAVMRFGPRWKSVTRSDGTLFKERIDPSFDQKAFDELRRFIEEEKPGINAINRRLL